MDGFWNAEECHFGIGALHEAWSFPTASKVCLLSIPASLNPTDGSVQELTVFRPIFTGIHLKQQFGVQSVEDLRHRYGSLGHQYCNASRRESEFECVRKQDRQGGNTDQSPLECGSLKLCYKDILIKAKQFDLNSRPLPNTKSYAFSISNEEITGLLLNLPDLTMIPVLLEIIELSVQQKPIDFALTYDTLIYSRPHVSTKSSNKSNHSITE